MESRSLPTAAKVFGILHCIFGGFSLAISPLSLLGSSSTMEVYRSYGINSLALSWIQLTLWLTPLTALIILVLGVGLLMRQSWSRPGAVIMGYILIAINLLSLVLLVSGFAGAAASGSPFAIGAIFGAVIGTLIGSIYPLLTIIFLSRDNIKAAYDTPKKY